MTLEEILGDSLSLNEKKRQESLNQITALSISPDFYYNLLLFASTTSNLHLKQLALITLKQNSNYSNYGFKDEIKRLLFDLLMDSSLQELVSILISQVGHYEYPTYWPTFVDDLINIINSDNVVSVMGGMRVLYEFVLDLDEQTFESVATKIMPLLYSIYTNSVSATPVDPLIEGKRVEIKVLVVGVLGELIETIHTVKEQHPQAQKVYFNPLWLAWYPIFTETLLKNQDPILKSKVLGIVLKSARYFKCDTDTVFESVLHGLLQLKSADRDDDSVKPFIESCIEFLDYYIHQRQHLQKINSLFDQTLDICLFYMKLSSEDISVYESDCNQFLVDDNESSHTLRNILVDILKVLMDNVSVVVETLKEVLLHAFEAKDASPDWWVIVESAFLLLGLYKSEFLQYCERKNDGSLDIVFQSYLKQCFMYDALPLLQGRAFWLYSKYSHDLPDVMKQEYTRACVLALASRNELCRICATKAVQVILSHGDQGIQVYQADILKSLLAMIDGSKDDCLMLLLETLQLAIELNDEGVVIFCDTLCHLMLKIWSEMKKDVFIMELVQDTFKSLAKNTLIAAKFQEVMYPVLVNVLKEGESVMKLGAVDLLQAMIKNVGDPFPAIYAEQMYPILIGVLENSEDSGLLQNGQELLKVLVERDFARLETAQVNNLGGLQAMLGFITQMLEPSKSESSAIFIGELITKLIQNGGDSLQPHLPQLLGSIIVRLQSAQMPVFIETLVLIFCSLIETKCPDVLQFLKQIHIQNQSGLEIFLTKFCETFDGIQGFYNVKLATFALILILMQKDRDTASIMCKGELIIENKKRIVTRSVSKQEPEKFTVVPFPVKAVQLLLEEYLSQQQSKMNVPTYESDEEYESLEDEDFTGFDFEEPGDEEYQDTIIYQLDLCNEIQGCLRHLRGDASWPFLVERLSKKHLELVSEIVD